MNHPLLSELQEPFVEPIKNKGNTTSNILASNLFTYANIFVLLLNILLLSNMLHTIFPSKLRCFDLPPCQCYFAFVQPTELTQGLAPANGVISFNFQRYKDNDGGEYAGSPRPELEDAWDDLMRGEVFRALKEDVVLANGNPEEVILLEHGGYLAGLNVYHELHCIEWIKRNYSRVQSIDELRSKEGHLG